MSILSRMVRKEMEAAASNQQRPIRKIQGIKTTRPYTAFLANNYGKGRVGRYSLMTGRSAVVPDGFELESQGQEEPASGPVSRSIVSDGAGIFNTEFLRPTP